MPRTKRPFNNMLAGEEKGLKPLRTLIDSRITVKQNRVDDIIAEAFAIEAQEAKDAGTLGFVARAITQATMPHRATPGAFFERKNGSFTLTMLAPPSLGLPYGSLPRLLMAWMTTEAVRTRERDLILGESLSDFMRQLGLVPTGGRWGSITRLQKQTQRLFASTLSCIYHDGSGSGEIGFRVADKHMLWWDPKAPGEAALWQSSVTLSQAFFDEIITSPVPVDMRALRTLKRSPLALDIYCWLTYRLSYLRAKTEIPWKVLATQFGADYKRTRDFKAAFIEEMALVMSVYQEANIAEGDVGLILQPSLPHIRPGLPSLSAKRITSGNYTL